VFILKAARTGACRISLLCTRDSRLSAAAALLLCLSPASVFLTYAYTEALFLLCTFAGIWVLAEGWPPVLAGLPFAGSCYVRSNGMLSNKFLPCKCLPSMPCCAYNSSKCDIGSLFAWMCHCSLLTLLLSDFAPSPCYSVHIACRASCLKMCHLQSPFSAHS
jgi:hypothetical protein